MPISYYSTNRSSPTTTLEDALLKGQAPDRGLYMPSEFPFLSPADLARLKSRSYAEIAHAVLKPFTQGTIEEAQLLSLCEDAYNYAVPIEHVDGKRYILRLDQGPTASFKDFAARMMARWMNVLLKKQNRKLLILTATSGDTGSAVAHAYLGSKHVRIVVLFPIHEVSTRQRKQMTTLGDNVTTWGIDGKFDDCQALVKRAFSDPDLSSMNLSSANSINIGRLLPQSVYYVYAYLKLADPLQDQPIVFSVPSGNFGDMMGAVFAKRMGIPIQRIVVSTNANDEVPKFLDSGIYQKIVPSKCCISNAMNVGHPSNLARLVDAYGGQMDEVGTLNKTPDMNALRQDLYGVRVSDEETRATIKKTYDQYGILLEPHGAVGWAGLSQYRKTCSEYPEPYMVSVETAHPAKFPEELRALLSIEPSAPPSLEGLESLPENYEQLSVEYEPFKKRLSTHST